MPARRSAASDETGRDWSPFRRRIASCLIAFHLAAVVFAPLSMDGAFGALFRPLQFLRTYATALYLDHGYRFFAPDPGPTHTFRFEHAVPGAEPVSIRLPDRHTTRPRLLYHRWFMLGESLAAEVANTLASYADYAAGQRQLLTDIAELQSLGRFRESIQLSTIHEINEQDFDRRWQMTLALSAALKQYLAEQYPGESIRLFSRRQLIPRPYDVLSGKPLSHPDFVQEIELTDPQAVLDAAKPEEISPPAGGSGP